MKRRDLLSTVARHEAGHAVIGWMHTGVSCDLIAAESGGLYTGTKLPILPHVQIVIVLAGIATECDFSPWKCDLEASKFDDLDVARGLIEETPYLLAIAGALTPHPFKDEMMAVSPPIPVTPEIALLHFFAWACFMLKPHAAAVGALGELLSKKGFVSAIESKRILSRYLPSYARE